MANTFDSARKNPVFQETLKRLVINQFCDDYDLPDKKQPIDISDLRKAAWLASILATSSEDGQQFIAASFAKLLYLQNSTDEERTQMAYTILSRTGNLAATRHLRNIYDVKADDQSKFKKSFGSVLDIEIGAKRNINKIDTSNNSFFVTDFQKQLWEGLKIHDKIAISAPTSAGKSFFVQHFIDGLFRQNQEFKVIYIIPTKALISQVSEEFKRILPIDVSIRTAFIDDIDFEEKNEASKVVTLIKKEIYCVTPERCLKLLQQGWKKIYLPDLIFIDEIQNVETNDNRGVLLEYVLSQVSALWSRAKILFAGPFIINGKELYEKLLRIQGEDINTYLPAVYQLRITAQATQANILSLFIHLPDRTTEQIDIPFDLTIKENTPNKSFLAPIVKRFGKKDRNIIYAAKANWCVGYAMEFITQIGKQNKPKEIHPAVKDLIDLLKEEIHEQFYLRYCLEYKVAFHHGKLPDVVKSEIEYLFENNHIEYLFCTSTLLQGVNLPAPRMFIVTPSKDSQDLTDFEFGNLIGRAGRIKDSMIGTIFCLEKSPRIGWSTKYFNADYKKKVTPTTETALQKEVTAFIKTMRTEAKELNHNGEEYTGNLLKQKFLENPEVFIAFVKSKTSDAEKIKSLEGEMKKVLKDVSITNDLVRLNPNIDPVLQNILLEKIIADGIEKWVLIDEENGNENYNKKLKRKEAELLPPSQRNFYFQFEHLLEKLDEIFGVKNESYKKRVPMNIRQMAFYAVTWLDSLTYAQLIKKELGRYKELDSEIKGSLAKLNKTNERITRVFTVNSVIVTYLLVKYFKLLSDILESKMSPEQKLQFRKTLNIHTMLELGTRKIEVLIMVSMGIPRAIALKLSILIPYERRESPILWLDEQTDLRALSKLKPYYVKYLFRRGFLSSLKEGERAKLL